MIKSILIIFLKAYLYKFGGNQAKCSGDILIKVKT